MESSLAACLVAQMDLANNRVPELQCTVRGAGPNTSRPIYLAVLDFRLLHVSLRNLNENLGENFIF